MGFHVRAEVSVVPGSQRRSADTLVLNWDKGDSAAHDWTVTHLLTHEGLRAYPTRPDWATELAESRKVTREGGLCMRHGTSYVPLAIDTFGGFGPSAKDALAKVANHERVRQ